MSTSSQTPGELELEKWASNIIKELEELRDDWQRRSSFYASTQARAIELNELIIKFSCLGKPRI